MPAAGAVSMKAMVLLMLGSRRIGGGRYERAAARFSQGMMPHVIGPSLG